MDQLLNQLDLTVQTLQFIPWWRTWLGLTGLGCMVGLCLFGIVWLIRRQKQTVKISDPLVNIKLRIYALDTAIAKAKQGAKSSMGIEYTMIVKEYLGTIYACSLTSFSDEQLSAWLLEPGNDESKKVFLPLEPIVSDLSQYKYRGGTLDVVTFQEYMHCFHTAIAEYEATMTDNTLN